MFVSCCRISNVLQFNFLWFPLKSISAIKKKTWLCHRNLKLTTKEHGVLQTGNPWIHGKNHPREFRARTKTKQIYMKQSQKRHFQKTWIVSSYMQYCFPWENHEDQEKLSIIFSSLHNKFFKFFFFVWVFFHEHSRFTGQQGKGEAIS